MHQGDDCAGVLNLAMLQAVLAERPGIRLPRSVAGAARGAPLPGAPGTTRGFIGSRPSRCIFLRAELAGAADSFRLLPRFLFRGFSWAGAFRMQLYLECYCACRRHQGCHCMKRKLRYVADFWAALGQAAACLYLVMWGVGRKEQWRIKKLRADLIR
jgi:hypothetical protein